MGTPNKYHPDLCDKLPELFSEGNTIVGVCVELGISRDCYYEWKKVHPEFAEAAKQGELASQYWWEKNGRDGIFGGVDKFAGSSWQFVMKNRFREDYRDEQAVQTNNTLIEKLLEKL